MATGFNRIRAYRELESAGAAKPLADAIASMLGDSVTGSREDLVTKDYLKAELATLRTEIATSKNDTIRWLLGSQVILFAALALLLNVGKLVG